MIHLILALALLLAGCAPPSPVIETAETPPSPAPSARGFLFGLRWAGVTYQGAYEPAARQAAFNWNQAVGRDLFTWDEAGNVILTQSLTRPSFNGQEADGVTIKTQDGKGALVALNAAIPEAAAYPVVAHELGHVLGLHHSQDPQDLMFATVTLHSHITPNDTRRALEALAGR
jgi:hypothetical protein